MHFREGTSCFSLEWDNDWSGVGGDNRPVNTMHFREGTSCFSLKWKNDWWGLGYVKHYWFLNVVTLRVPLACDYYHRVLVAEQGGEHIDYQVLVVLYHQYYFPNLIDGWNLVQG